MSKRAGNIVTVDELLNRIDVDVVRFFFLMYSLIHMNFDMGLAEERSQKNPVFYVQYAHARMASIFRKAEEELGMNMQEFSVNQEEIHLQNSKEILLVRHLARFSEVLCSAVGNVYCAPASSVCDSSRRSFPLVLQRMYGS
ncbi:MAG: hypothetical protein IPJ67_00065 [Candidatus Moraniibacteriota bacterium]|nr:MAG: hypothetical protein IPJ67_00065 [Candidatus Moranbacteria bacterium]